MQAIWGLPCLLLTIVIKKPTRESRLTVLPSVKTKDFLRSRMALRMQYICRQHIYAQQLVCLHAGDGTNLLDCDKAECMSVVLQFLKPHLLCTDRQHVQVDAVELIKAAPQATLGQTLVDFAHALVVHLVTAVEHHHIPA